eukprot:CAMPEP_0172864510 /NCGR_PEP_ID=MMETSP1075-20121228/80481_1 /TAXON_ID=2916 /ORGANISM="Ceratium fusus, Strain PA161109" /LENGTH=46 /DNA_ID= /DNA_START= /DNA_END= /DNA_ORIENTATION=
MNREKTAKGVQGIAARTSFVNAFAAAASASASASTSGGKRVKTTNA